MYDIKKKIESNDGQKSESSHLDHHDSSHIQGYSDNHYSDQNIKVSVQNAVSRRMADYNKTAQAILKKGGQSKRISGSSR